MKQGQGVPALGPILALALLASCHCVTAAPTPSSSIPESPARRCEAGDRAACGEAMASVLARKVVAGDLPAARKACDLDEPLGCTVLGLAAADGIGAPRNAARAFGWARRACELGGALGCRMTGDALKDGAGTAQDSAVAALLYDRACEGGDGLACYKLGLITLEGEVVDREPDRLEALLRKGCVAHVAESCDLLSEMYHAHVLGPVEPARTLELDTLACDGGAALPCLDLFKLQAQDPNGDPLRWGKLIRLVALTCERGEPQGCELGARIHRDLQEECGVDHPGKCYVLGLTHLYGVGTPRDEASAREVLGKVCKRGLKLACDELKTIGNNR